MEKPNQEEYHPFYADYVNLCEENDVYSALQNSLQEWQMLINSISEDLKHKAYGTGKWTVNQLLAHCIDTERIFQYRILRIAREDHAALSGFNEDDFAANYTAQNRSIKSLSEEFENVRRSTLFLFESLDSSIQSKTGNADGKPISIRALGFITAGHSRHHLNILKERYL